MCSAGSTPFAWWPRTHPGEVDVYRAAVLLIFAMLFDMMDGRVARMTKTQSAFGLQLDSLADIISFGVAPALLVYKWVLHREPIPGILTAFMFVSCAAIRLARFNVLSSNSSGAPTKPGKYILGLPSPPSAGILISLIVANHGVGGALGDKRYTLLLFCVTLGLGLLMVSNVRFRSFKELKLNSATLLFVLFTVGSSVFVVAALQAAIRARLAALDVRLHRPRGNVARSAVAPPPARPRRTEFRAPGNASLRSEKDSIDSAKPQIRAHLETR